MVAPKLQLIFDAPTKPQRFVVRIRAGVSWHGSGQATIGADLNKRSVRDAIENETEPLRGADQGKPWAALRRHGADLDRHWVVRIC